MNAPIRTLVLATLLLPGMASAQSFRIPDCTTILTWYGEATKQPGEALTLGWPGLGGFTTRELPTLYASPLTTRTFGAPVLEWSTEDTRALSTALSRCMSDRGLGDHRATFRDMRGEVIRSVTPFVQTRERSLESTRDALAALAEAPFDPSIGPLFAVLPGADNNDALEAAREAARRVRGEARRPALALVSARRGLLPQDAEALIAPVAAAQVPLRRQQAREARLAELQAVPEDLQGLRQLDRLAQQDLADRGVAPEDHPAMEAALEGRRAAVVLAMVRGYAERAAEVSEDAAGLSQLDRLGRDFTLRQLPEAAQLEVQQALEERRQAVVVAAVRRFQSQAAEASDDLEGLRLLDSMGRVFTLRQLPEAAQAEVTASIEARREQVRAAMVAAMRARIESLPSSAEGVAEAEQMLRSREIFALGDAAAELRGRIEARSGEMAHAALNATLAEMIALPAGMDGLRDGLRLWQQGVGMGRHVDRAALTAFAENAGKSLSAVAEGALGEMERELAAMPATDETLMMLRRRGVPEEAWPGAAELTRQRFIAAIRAREGEIRSVVNAAEAGPLAGRSYALRDGRMRLEFEEEGRVVLTERGTEGKVAGTYEEATGDRILITLPDRNYVLQREGRRLDGGGLMFWREEG